MIEVSNVSDYCVPIDSPTPDAEAFIRCLMGEERPQKPPLVEYVVDDIHMCTIISDMLGRQWVPAPSNGTKETGSVQAFTEPAYWDNLIEFWYRMGYDFVRLELSLDLPRHHLLTEDTAQASEGQRAWADEHHRPISSWEDFEQYPWPTLTEADFFPHEYIDSHLPEGMGLMSCHAGGICEHVRWIMSYEGLSLALYDNPELISAVIERVGTLMEQYYQRLVHLDNLIAIFPGDDMGFRTQTLISPDDLREYFLPWHRRFAQIAHDAKLPYFLHSCGNIEAIMKDLIEDVGIDGKHSFEDSIIPAGDFQKRYGEQIAVLGGIDIHKLASYSPEQLRGYVRSMIDECAPSGRFAIGSGNSIPSYIPLENYLTMLDEALR